MDNDFDATEYWNTPLDPDHEAEFQAWAKRGNYLKDLYDYDMRGAYLSGIRPDEQSGHWPDTYKKPNHPTFSDESQYHGSEGHMGGYWEQDETGTETWHPYDPRRDPEALGRQVGEGERGSQVLRASAGLGEQSNNADIVDRLRHPTYQQLADDKDLRRGQTRMAPRGAGAEGGFGYQQGGTVEKNPNHTEMTDELYPGAGQGEGDEEMSEEEYQQRMKVYEADKAAGRGGLMVMPDDYQHEDPEGRPPTNLPDKPHIIRKQLSDPEHGTWHDDGKHQIFTPHPSFFARVKPMELADHFERYAPDDHHLNLP